MDARESLVLKRPHVHEVSCYERACRPDSTRLGKTGNVSSQKNSHCSFAQMKSVLGYKEDSGPEFLAKMRSPMRFC